MLVWACATTWAKPLSRRLMGLSGGIDSALVLAIAVDALGRTRCAR
jgi:NH3-dependent NAD+ synthetase